MQRLKKAALSKLTLIRSTTPSSPSPFHRIFSQSPPHRCFFSEPSQSPRNPITKLDPTLLRNQNEVLVEGKSNARTAILNRPSKLNALTYSMAARLNKLYESWEENADIGFVTMRGSGRAFSAGADVVALYNSINQGKVEECKEFFGTLYKFVYLLGTYTKPHVAVMDGFTLGCGAGVGIPGTFRVATDKTVFATPETQIGFHPDAGASFYLSRLPGYLGEYLALTGEKLNGVEMVTCGLATHYALHENLSVIEERLAKLITDLPSVVGNSLTLYGQFIYPERRSVLHRIESVDKCFSQDTVEDIIDALENEAAATNEEWCILALKRLKEASPLSLKISLRSIREGRFQPLERCLRREFRMSARAVSKHVSNDFCEGVRALLLDKDYAPKWDPPCLEHVSKDMVDYYFAPFSELEPELDLPTAFREPFI